MALQRFENQDVLKQILKMRGFYYLSSNPIERLIFYPTTDDIIQSRFYELLKKYSFRIFLRDLIKMKDDFCRENLKHYCSSKTIERYLKFLLRYNVISLRERGHFQLNNLNIRSFGDTFEWFIAQIFQREFSLPAFWGIRMKETEGGGDYDVMTFPEGSFIYVETKSSPPKHIELTEICAFLNRVNDLNPQMAVFVEDTMLRMKDKIVVMFQEALKNMYGKRAEKYFPVHNFKRELYRIKDSLFIINSRPNLVTNLGLCISHFLKSKGISFNIDSKW